MACDADLPHRRSIRLRGYDYAEAGAYFVTLCTEGRACLFGEIIDGAAALSDAGRMVQDLWDQIPTAYPGVETGAFVVMPNHIHGVIILAPDALTGTVGQDLGTEAHPIALADVVARFKSLTTRRYCAGVAAARWPRFRGRLWQRNYYEHVVRDEYWLDQIRQYIEDNPAKWADDNENPANTFPCPRLGPLP